MPIIVSGGGGGGIAGYKYPPGNVKDIDISKSGSNFYLTWEDPDNVLVEGKYLSEWKGTIVIRNRDHKPNNATDGEMLVNSIVKDQYKNTGLNLGVNGDGCYYGVFPYTKSFVFNVSDSNIIYYPTEGYSGNLSNATWNDIIWVAGQGIAQDLWNVGDVTTLTLNGEEYNFDVNMQIIGFNHDDLVGGGRANISFLLKDIFEVGTVSGQGIINTTNFPKNCVSLFGNQNSFFSKVKSCMPKKVLDNMKRIYKRRASYVPSYNASIVKYDVDMFGLSSFELGYTTYGAVSSGEVEGRVYDFFRDGGVSVIRRNSKFDKTKDFWIQTATSKYSYADGGTRPYMIYFDNEQGNLAYESRNARGWIFGFCI